MPGKLYPIANCWMLLSGACWLTLCACGAGILLQYAATPGSIGVVGSDWPQDSRILPSSTQGNLLLFVHPHCPCSRASIAELAEIVSHGKDRVSTQVLFIKPLQAPARWEETDLWRSAAQIPGVEVLTDEGGAEARRFGAKTSGHVLFYDNTGRLVYSGGITMARGHRGDNAGRSSVVGLLTAGKSTRATDCVYGCPLFLPDNIGGTEW